MTDKQIFKLAKENQNISQKKSTKSEVWPVDKQEVEYVEEQKEKEKTEPETNKIYTTDPQDSMEGVLSSIVQKVKESSNPSSDETKEEADKRKEENT